MCHRCLAAGSTTSLAAGLASRLTAGATTTCLNEPGHRRPTAAACRAAALLIHATA